MIIGLLLKVFFAERMKNPINPLWVVLTASTAHPYAAPKNLPNLYKSLQTTLESFIIKTAVPIVKCHTILELGSHDLSPHTYGTGPPFWKGAQKGVYKNLCLNLFYAKGGSNQMN